MLRNRIIRTLAALVLLAFVVGCSSDSDPAKSDAKVEDGNKDDVQKDDVQKDDVQKDDVQKDDVQKDDAQKDDAQKDAEIEVDQGVSSEGFGAICDPNSQPPKACTSPEYPLCLSVDSGHHSYCTKTCTNAGGLCTGAPAGTSPLCVLSIEEQTDLVCGFVCEFKGSTFDCPGELECALEEQGAKVCAGPAIW